MVKNKKISDDTTSHNLLDISINDENLDRDHYLNYLYLNLHGKIIDNIILNTLRRVIKDLVPTYGFNRKDINIEKNTSIYNDDFMTLHISLLPVIGIENNRDTVLRYNEFEFIVKTPPSEQFIEDLTIIKKKEDEERKERLQNFTMSINYNNTTNKIATVTTDDAIYHYKGTIINNPYKEAIAIIELKPGEEFICTAYSSLNIGLAGPQFENISGCCFVEPDDKKNPYIFKLESLNQLTEKEYIIRACMIINDKLDKLNNKIATEFLTYSNKADDTDYKNIGRFIIDQETHTFGNLLAKMLQDNEHINFAGNEIQHLLIEKTVIKYNTDGTDIVEIINEVIIKAKNIFELIQKKIEAL